MNRPIITTICFGLLLSGCASQYAPLKRVTPGASIQVEVYTSGEYARVLGDEKVGKGALKGSGRGALAGAGAGAVAGLTCGPLLVFCVPLGMMAGAGTGAIVGGVAGGVHGAVTSLPKEKAQQFNVMLTEHMSPEVMTVKLKSALLDAATPEWAVTSEPGSERVVVVLHGLGFGQHSGDRLSLRLLASMEMMYSQGAQRTRPYSFQYNGPTVQLNQLLTEDGGELAAALDLASSELARQMTDALRHPPLVENR
ncbi:MAG: hypothetical protein O2780_03950 [Proteobacteria bacterium]|nr:hypothetical protein [Pseudomonadota bacterium]MDA1300711.1 hypothetical protein [Pseudomonadota bacterium]